MQFVPKIAGVVTYFCSPAFVFYVYFIAAPVSASGESLDGSELYSTPVQLRIQPCISAFNNQIIVVTLL